MKMKRLPDGEQMEILKKLAELDAESFLAFLRTAIGFRETFGAGKEYAEAWAREKARLRGEE